MTRRVLTLMLLVCSTSCLDETLTLGEACMADEECLGKQICGRTAEEISAALPGLCVEPGDPCVFGRQLGCACNAGSQPNIDDDTCVTQPPRYQAATQIFVTCDKVEGSPTYGTCVLDDGSGGGTGG